MRRKVPAILPSSVAAVILIGGSAQAADISSGSGVVIGTYEILTNAHVVEQCAEITVRLSNGNLEAATLVAHDKKNDFAVIRTKTPLSSVAAFRDGRPLRAGEAVVALGYPLSGLLATTANLSVGNVSALAGLGDDTRYLQISAPVQPGNSGGPLFDASGHIVGIVTAKLDAALVARFTGDIPQNVNFALKAELARAFLDSNGITYQTATSYRQLSPADVGEVARPSTVYIECKSDDFRTAGLKSPYDAQQPSERPRVTSIPKSANVRQSKANERVIAANKGDTVVSILRDIGATLGDIKAIVAGFGPVAETLKEGDVVRILIDSSSGYLRLQRVVVLRRGKFAAAVALSDLGNFVPVDPLMLDLSEPAPSR
jgi:S1-C subfamily serine protease